LQVARVDGLVALPCEAGHAFAFGNAADDLDDLGRDVDRGFEAEVTAVAEVNRSGHTAVARHEAAQPLLELCIRHGAQHATVASGCRARIRPAGTRLGLRRARWGAGCARGVLLRAGSRCG